MRLRKIRGDRSQIERRLHENYKDLNTKEKKVIVSDKTLNILAREEVKKYRGSSCLQ